MLHYGVGSLVNIVVVGLSCLYSFIFCSYCLPFSSCALYIVIILYIRTHSLSEDIFLLFYKEIYIYIYLSEEIYQRKGDELEKHMMGKL